MAALGAWAFQIGTSLGFFLQPSWLAGISITNIVDGITDTASFERAYDLQAGVGLQCAQVPLASFPFSLSHVRYTAVGEINSYLMPVWLPYPIRLPGPASGFLWFRGASNDCAATHTINVSAIAAGGVGR